MSQTVQVFDEDAIRLGMRQLPPWKRLAFMAYCCERMLPNFKKFVAETGFGDVGILRRALDAVWARIENDLIPMDLNDLRTACDQQAPDTGNFASRYTSAALDAANGISTALDAVERDDVERAIEIASLARDTVDLYVQEQLHLNPSEAGFERKLLMHQLMQRELSHQRASLEFLQGLQEERRFASSTLRQKWSNLEAGSLSCK
jgi:uncharacterized protein YjaG (DUF416 family)